MNYSITKIIVGLVIVLVVSYKHNSWLSKFTIGSKGIESTLCPKGHHIKIKKNNNKKNRKTFDNEGQSGFSFKQCIDVVLEGFNCT
jgi:hypothetical protein